MSVSPRVWAEKGQPVQVGKGGAAGREQLARLFQLVSLLQTERFPRASDLAERCEVSLRTIYRDIRLLREAGVPIESQANGQGYHLASGAFLPPPNLTEEEAIALLILGFQGNGGEGIGLAPAARAGAAKAVQALPVAIRERVVVATQSVRPEGGAEPPGPDRRAVRRAVLEALTRQKQLRLWYREQGTGELLGTKFTLYRLLLVEGEWSLVGRASVDRRVIVLGLPWVERAVATDDDAQVPPRFNLHRFLGRAWSVRPSPLHYQVWLRFDAWSASRILDAPRRRGERRERRADGGLDVRIEVDGLDEIVAWLLTFGDTVEVLAPAELRGRLHDLAERVARRHEPRAIDPSTIR